MKKKRVLIVEDEGIIARDVRQKLEDMEYTVVGTASTAEEAIQKARRLSPHVVLMDIVLRGSVDGIAAARTIGDELGIPIIFLTAFADDNTLARAKLTKPYGYILKPFDENDLRTNIEIALYRSVIEKKRDAEARMLGSILLCAGSALIVTDLNLTVTLINRTAERVLCLQREDAIGKRLPDVFQVRFSAAGVSVASLTALALREGTSLRLPDDSEILLRDGTSRHINCVITPVKQEDNRITGLVVTFQCVDRGEDPAAQKPTTLTAAIGRLTAVPMDSVSSAILRALTFIEENIERPISLDELAGLSYMSRFHFSRTFKARTGMTPMSLIAHVRIERSMSLLRQNPDCVSDIALAVGFSSLSHFTDQFKRITGMTPSEYRKGLKK